MSSSDTQNFQRIIHTELKKLTEKLESLEREFNELSKTIRYDFSYIKETALTKNHLDQNTQDKTAADDTENSALPTLIHQALRSVIDNSLVPTIQRVVHEETRTLKEELEYLKKHYPTLENLQREAEGLHMRIVKSLTPKPKELPPPLPHRPQL